MGIRCFIAVEVPAPLRVTMGGIAEDLKKCGADVKWVRPENIHITLKFLGDTEEPLLTLIEERLSKKLFNYKPFCIRISGAGSFPSGRHPRVIWVGIEESPALLALQRDVEFEVRALGYAPEERPFLAHITIGRVKTERKLSSLAEKLEVLRDKDIGSFEIRTIKLMKSELGRGGPVYTSLAGIPLNYS
ncbi:MAG: RNA 2',3'-cyclic phosphodiesterase [Thermodesulfovibrio sp.]|nr:RNA 2',3'-cyclic phosphodiesterase [Thermodesulfovibrio sp.]